MPDALSADFFARSVHEVAPDLIGVTLLVDGVGGAIVEVEAYDPTDPASHAYRGPHAAERRRCSARRATRTSTAPTGSTGASTSSARRRARRRRSCCARWSRPRASSGCASGAASTTSRLLAAGPGRLCEALGVTGEHDGLPLDRPPFELLPTRSEPEIVAAPRIGITRAADYPWRYVLDGLALPQPRVLPRA